MAENRWFKVWGREVLASVDLRSLTDHEERVWWRLMAAASCEEPRWTIEESPALAQFCASTPPKFAAALRTFESRRMVSRDGSLITLANAEKYQETPEARRKREQRERERGSVTSHGQTRDMSQDKRVTSHVTSHGHVRGIAIAREAEAEAEADLSAAAESGGGEIIDIGFRDRYGTLVTAFGGRVDERVADEFRQMANDYTQGQINEAITLARRSKSGQLYPSRISRFLPDLAPRVNPRAAQNGEFKLRNAWDMMAPIAGEPAPEADQ